MAVLHSGHFMLWVIINQNVMGLGGTVKRLAQEDSPQNSLGKTDYNS